MSNKITWVKNDNGNGFTGTCGNLVAVVLNGGSWAVREKDQYIILASGRALSVIGAKAKCREKMAEVQGV